MKKFLETSFSKEAYEEALEWLFVQMPSYQTEGRTAYKPGLDNIRKLCHFFGNPQDQLQVIHIAGTNGKGSTSNMVASMMQEQGYKVGLYTSPHLVSFTERIKVNGQNCPTKFVFECIQKLKNLPEDIQPSFFEFTTIMAFEYFRQQKVDFAIIEVGLGGRLDSTNILTPLVCGITNVDYDHQDLLGDTLEQIAQEKAGIIKPNIPVVTGEERDHIKNILLATANENNAKWVDATQIQHNYSTDLKGKYQQKNSKVPIGIIEELRKLNIQISEQAVLNGLQRVQQNTGFIGRWTKVSEEPLILCDTAHNQAGIKQVFQQLGEYPQFKHMVLGFVKEKKIEEVLEMLPNNAQYYFVKPSIHRGRSPKDYENLLHAKNLSYQLFETVWAGFQEAKKNCDKDELIFIGGSNFVVGEFLEKNLEI